MRKTALRIVALGAGCASSMAMAQQVPPPPPVAQAVPTQSAIPVPPPAPPIVAPPPAGKQPSAYVRCDGMPNNMSSGELAARVIALSLVVGLLAPPHESGDISKRYTGLDGIAACDTALTNETDEVRRAQLMLARAIHHIEAGHYDAAIEDAQAVHAMNGPVASTIGFRQSLAVSALELQAAAQLRQHKPADAERTAIAMANESPWDLDNYVHAMRYVGLTPTLTPEKRQFLDHYVRLRPDAVRSRATAREWAGDFAGAAADIEMMLAAFQSFAKADAEPAKVPAVTALVAGYYALAGQMEKARAMGAQARKEIDAVAATPDAMSHNSEIGEADEGLDFLDVLDKAASGQADAARATFAARSRWMTPGTPAVALTTERLRVGAKPAQLIGALAADPETIRKTAFEQRIAALTEGKGAPNLLWSAVRAPVGAGAFTALAHNSWKTDKSKYMVPIKPGTGLGEGIVIINGSGIAAGEALLLHAALIAKTRGKSAFLLMPVRKRLDVAIVRFGNPGEPGFPADMTLDADAVIAGLAPIIPEPPKR